MKRITTTITIEETNEQYQFYYLGKIHKVTKLENDKHAWAMCGIDSDQVTLLKNEEITCDECKNQKLVQFDRNLIITDSETGEEYYRARSFADARQWCYKRSAIGFDVRQGIFRTKIWSLKI